MIMRRTLVIAALAFGFATPALAQMKEGTFSGTYSSYGTAKATAIGKERLLVALDENGLTLTNGFADHMTWHCWGTADFTNGAGQAHGYCVGIDPAGDQVVANFGPDEKHAPDQKTWSGSATYTTGTGKFAGIIGGWTYVIHSNEFRPATEGTYVNYATFEGRYKLPATEATGSTAPPATTPSK
jgi:hypothetical protein